MPTYQYECEACGYRMEMMQSMTAAKITQCPACKENALHRLIGTGGGLIFKGAGFYQTDYKNKSCPVADSCPAAETKSGCGCSGDCGHNK